MKLIIKRYHEEKAEVVKGGIFGKNAQKNEIEYRLFCQLVVSESEIALIRKYVGSDPTLTYELARAEPALVAGVKYRTYSSNEYSSREEANKAKDSNETVMPKLAVSHLINGVTYTERSGVGALLYQEEVLKDACQKLRNQMSNRSSYKGDVQVEFD